MPHSQPTALQQTVCKFHLDPHYHIFYWGSTILGDSTLCLFPVLSKHKDQFKELCWFLCCWLEWAFEQTVPWSGKWFASTLMSRNVDETSCNAKELHEKFRHTLWAMLFELAYCKVQSFKVQGDFGLHPANKRRRYFVTTSLIGWAQTWNQPCRYVPESWPFTDICAYQS